MEHVSGLLEHMDLMSLIIVSIIESIFFPVPPDAILIPMTLSSPRYGIWYGIVTTLASTVGALIGYVIGLRGGRPVLERFFDRGKISRVQRLFRRYDIWAVVIAGLTPIPFKVFTISAGVFALSRRRFVFACILGRGARFVTEAALLMLFGGQVVLFLKRYFGLVTFAAVALAAAGYVLYRKFMQKARTNRRN